MTSRPQGAGMQANDAEASKVTVPAHMALLAWALILGGVFIAVFVLQQLLSAYLDVDSNPFVGDFAERLSGSTLMTFGDFPLVLTEQGATVMAYFVFIPLALIGIHVAVALIRAGSHILSPVFPYQMARLRQRIGRLSDRMDEKSGG